MKNNIEILENIMKPYYDKKEQIANAPIALENDKLESSNRIHDMKTERISRRKELEIELENLRVRSKIAIEDFKSRMDEEIEEYINSALNTDSNFFSSYGSMLRKDLEQEYNKKLTELEENFKQKEQELVTEIASLKAVSQDERDEKKNLEDLSNKVDYSRVDLRELVEIKENIRKQLYAEQKRLNNELKQQQINFDTTMLQLSNFKYEYNDQQQVINGADWRAIYENGDKIADNMKDIKDALKKIEEYLGVAKLTNEEAAAIMRSMTPWEKEEYDRRKGNIDNGVNEINDSTTPVSEEKDENKIVEDVVEINDPVTATSEEKDGNVVVDDMENLLKTIYNDIVKEAINLRAVKLNESKEKLGENELYISSKSNNEDYQINGTIDFNDSVKLPCGEYLYESDINEAVENLFNKSKGKKYVVKETGNEYNVSKFDIFRLKRKLKKCSRIKLIKENKLSKFDLLKVFGKQSSDKMIKEVETSKLENVKVPEGEYINRNQFIERLDNLFTTKKLEWLTKLSNKLKEKQEQLIEKIEKSRNDDDIDLYDDFGYKIK